MIKQLLLFLIGLSLFVSCKEVNEDNEAPTTSDTVAIKKEIPEPKMHPAEEKSAFYLSEIDRYRAANEYDSLIAVNKYFIEYLKAVCLDEKLLQHPFDSLNGYRMAILTSEDKKFRIYCWDTETGGTMHFYNALVQYKTGSGSAVYVLNDIGIDDRNDCGVWYTELHTVHAKSGQPYSLPMYYGRFSTIEHSNGISAYTIQNSELDKPKIFKPLGKPLSEIYFDFTNGSLVKESTDNRISLSADKTILSIPVVDDDRVVTDRSLIYKFDGNQFVFDKNGR